VKKLRFFFIVAMVFLIKVMMTIAIGRPVDPLKICMGVLGVVGIGLLITLRVWSVNKELDERLKRLAELREVGRRIEQATTNIDVRLDGGQYIYVSNDRVPSNTVTPMSFINGLWVEDNPIAVPTRPTAVEAPENKTSETEPKEPSRENRLTRVLKDDYPL
jgi:hypothetical protein